MSYRPPCAVCRDSFSSFPTDLGSLCADCYALWLSSRSVVDCPACGDPVPASLLVLHASCRGDPGHVVLYVTEA